MKKLLIILLALVLALSAARAFACEQTANGNVTYAGISLWALLDYQRVAGIRSADEPVQLLPEKEEIV